MKHTSIPTNASEQKFNQTEGVFTAVSTYVKRRRTVNVVRTLVSGANGKLIADVTTNHVQSR